jgi:hypothetical protein
MPSYKGHQIVNNGDGSVTVQPYGKNFSSMKEAMGWTDDHVKQEAKKSSTPGSIMDLIKGTAQHRVDYSLSKAGGGWTAIPHGKRGGQRKKVGGKWQYRYSKEGRETASAKKKEDPRLTASVANSVRQLGRDIAALQDGGSLSEKAANKDMGILARRVTLEQGVREGIHAKLSSESRPHMSRETLKLLTQSAKKMGIADPKAAKTAATGGNVIGHTGSGKPIYASSKKHAADHKHLDAADHKSAHEFHQKLVQTHHDAGEKAMAAGNADKAHDHWHTSDYHVEQSQQHELAHHKKAGTRVPGHIAHWRHTEVFSDPALADHAAKINAQSKKSEAPSPDLVKGDKEGSRGGNVIGHTGSGNAIYASKHEGKGDFHKKYRSYTSADHSHAAKVHDDHAQQSAKAVSEAKKKIKDSGGPGSVKTPTAQQTKLREEWNTHLSKKAYHSAMAGAHRAQANAGHDTSPKAHTQRQERTANAFAESAGRQHRSAFGPDGAGSSKKKPAKKKLSSIISRMNEKNAPPGGWTDADMVGKSATDNPDLVKAARRLSEASSKAMDDEHDLLKAITVYDERIGVSK